MVNTFHDHGMVSFRNFAKPHSSTVLIQAYYEKTLIYRRRAVISVTTFTQPKIVDTSILLKVQLHIGHRSPSQCCTTPLTNIDACKTHHTHTLTKMWAAAALAEDSLPRSCLEAFFTLSIQNLQWALPRLPFKNARAGLLHYRRSQDDDATAAE